MPRIDAATLVRRFYDDLWNQANEAIAHEILHPALTFRGSLGPQRSGPDGFVGYLREVRTALADFRCIIEDLITTDCRVAARMTFTGTHRATFFGVAATGQTITWSGAAFFNIADQRIKDIWVLGNIDSIKQKLGVSPPATFGQS
jgi:steroid delta-isomerase-like uncharacterized protein